MKTLQKIALGILILGGLMWGSIGILGWFYWNLVSYYIIQGRILYIIIGFAALYSISIFFNKDKKLKSTKKYIYDGKKKYRKY